MRKDILGVNVDFGLTMDSVIKKIDDHLKHGKSSELVATTSPYFIMSAQEDPEFKEIINKSLLSIPDGIGVLYAQDYLSRVDKLKKDALFPIKAFASGLASGVAGALLKKDLGVQLTGVELAYKLFELAEKNDYTVFLLGGRARDSQGNQLDYSGDDMATNAANIIRKLHPNIRIIGATSEFSREEKDDIVTRKYIHKCMQKEGEERLDILLVAYNPVNQEKWVERNAKHLPSMVSVGVGRTFDYITDEMRPPSRIYEKLHIAWLYALIKQPWRYKRILMSFPIFPLKVFFRSIKM